VLSRYTHLALPAFVFFFFVQLCRTCVFVYFFIRAGFLIDPALLSTRVNTLNWTELSY